MPGAPLEAYVAVAGVVFAIGAAGAMVRRSPISMLMCIEVMWNAANLAFIAYARRWMDLSGHVFAFLAITVAAAEVAVGLALVVLIFRSREQVDLDDVRRLAG